MVGRPAVAGAAGRRRERVERPALADGTGGAGGQEVGGRALLACRLACQFARRDEMELRPLRRRHRVEQRLVDDRVHGTAAGGAGG